MTAAIFETTARSPSRNNPRGLPRPAPLALCAQPAVLTTPIIVASSNDAALIGVLDSPAAPGETCRDQFARKEVALRAAFASLSVATQRALHRRLSAAAPGDVLAERFSRLAADRRARLLAFLGDARRREALNAR